MTRPLHEVVPIRSAWRASKEKGLSALMGVQRRHQTDAIPAENPEESFNQTIITHKTGLLKLATPDSHCFITAA